MTSSPTQIVLTFDEPVEATLGGIRLYDAQEHRLDVGEAGHVPGHDDQLQAPVEETLGKGLYVVTWRALSADSHPVSGAFTFQVGSGAVGDTSALVDRLQAAQGASPALGVLLSVSRFVGYIALAALVGAFAFVVVVWPGVAGQARFRRLAWGGWALLVLSATAALVLEGPYAAARPVGDAFDATLLRDVIETHYGHALVLRLGALVVAGGLLATLRFAGRRLWQVAAGLTAAALALSVAYAGHASTGRWNGLGLVLGAVHVAAMAVWLGGLVHLAAVALRTRSPAPAARSVGAAVPVVEPVTGAGDAEAGSPGAPSASVDLGTVVERFSRLAFGCVLVLVATGVTQAWRLLDGLSSIWDTDYGRRLLLKTALVVAVIAIAAVVRRTAHRRPPEPGRLRRLVVTELCVALAILGVTAVLVGTPPPRAAAANSTFTTTLVQQDMIASIAIEPARQGNGNTLHVYISPPGGSLARVDSAEARLTLPSRDLGPIPVPLTSEGVNHYASYGVQLPYKGAWQLELLVDVGSSQTRFSTHFPVT